MTVQYIMQRCQITYNVDMRIASAQGRAKLCGCKVLSCDLCCLLMLCKSSMTIEAIWPLDFAGPLSLAISLATSITMCQQLQNQYNIGMNNKHRMGCTEWVGSRSGSRWFERTIRLVNKVYKTSNSERTYNIVLIVRRYLPIQS